VTAADLGIFAPSSFLPTRDSPAGVYLGRLVPLPLAAPVVCACGKTYKNYRVHIESAAHKNNETLRPKKQQDANKTSKIHASWGVNYRLTPPETKKITTREITPRPTPPSRIQPS
jgi:hypothetical protein